MPPEGSWKPNISLATLLTSIHVLLGAPNLDDPIRPDLVPEWRNENMTMSDSEERMHALESNSAQFASPKRAPASVSSLSLSKIRKRPKMDQTEPQE